MLLGIIGKSENSSIIEVLRCVLIDSNGTSVVVNVLIVPMYMDRKFWERKNQVELTLKLNDPGLGAILG